jgi:hypothetical protein
MHALVPNLKNLLRGQYSQSNELIVGAVAQCAVLRAQKRRK